MPVWLDSTISIRVCFQIIPFVFMDCVKLLFCSGHVRFMYTPIAKKSFSFPKPKINLIWKHTLVTNVFLLLLNIELYKRNTHLNHDT